MMTRYDELEAKIEYYRTTCDEPQLDIDEALNSKEYFKNRVAELKEERKDLRERIEELEIENNKLRDEIASIVTNEDLLADLNGANTALEMLEEENKQISAERDKWVGYAEEGFERIKELEARLHSNGECALEETDSYDVAYETVHVLECSACGRTCEYINGAYNYCPNCGAKGWQKGE